MENHKVSRFFPSSFTSCRLRTLTDVVQSSISATRNRHENQFPKITLDGDSGFPASSKDDNNDKKATLVLGYYFSPSIDGRRCPPATPISAVAPPPASSTTTSSISGETHRESDTLFSFSSKELSQEDEFEYYSDSSSSSFRRKTRKPRRKTAAKKRCGRRGWTAGFSAIEKSTSDPYGEFRKSMMEMIVEKQIFRAEDLNALLHCFLSLNSPYFHEVIVEVYLEIIETLFTN